MFKALRKPGKTKENFEVRLRFHANRIPNGYEKLVVSVVAVDTNRVGAQTPRAVVKNGKCQWTDTIVEEVKLVRDNKTKSYESKPYRLVVSTGSIKSNVLGEAVINVAEFAIYGQLDQRALPLKYCQAGTILHATIQCIKVEAKEEDEVNDGPNSGSLSQSSSGRGVPIGPYDAEGTHGESDEGGSEYSAVGSQSSNSIHLQQGSAGANQPTYSLPPGNAGQMRAPQQIPSYTVSENAPTPMYAADMESEHLRGGPPADSSRKPYLVKSASLGGSALIREEHALRQSMSSDYSDSYGRRTGHRRMASDESIPPRPRQASPGRQYATVGRKAGSSGIGASWESASQGSGSSAHTSPNATPTRTVYQKPVRHLESPQRMGTGQPGGRRGERVESDGGDAIRDSREGLQEYHMRRSMSASSPRYGESSGRSGSTGLSPRYGELRRTLTSDSGGSQPIRRVYSSEANAMGNILEDLTRSLADGDRAESNSADMVTGGRSKPLPRSKSFKEEEFPPLDPNTRPLTRNLTDFRQVKQPIEDAGPEPVGRGAYYVPGAVTPVAMGPIPPDFSPPGSVASSRNPAQSSPGAAGLASSRDLRADLQAAEAAIEELQSESVAWQRASRNLSREVENLRQQLAEAMTQDRAAEMEIQALSQERDRLRGDVERLQATRRLTEEEEDGHEATRWEAVDARRSVNELAEDMDFQKDTIENLSLQLRKLQEANRELQLAVEDSESTVEQYKKDLEELFESNKEHEASLKRAQLALDDKDREWKERMKKVIDVHNALELKLAQAEAKLDVEGRAVEAVAQPSESAQVAELERKVDELEKEAQELSEESLQLASELNKAKKEMEGKSALVDRLQAELEKAKAAQSSGSKLFSGWGTGGATGKAFAGGAAAGATAGLGVPGEGTSGGGGSMGSSTLSGAAGGGTAAGLSGAAASGGGGSMLGVGGAIAGALGVGVGAGAAGVSAAEVLRLKGQVAELEKQLKKTNEEREAALSGGAFGPAAGSGSDDVQKLKNRLRISEMATQRAQERMSILETIEKKAGGLEAELREKKEEVARLVKGREEWEAGLTKQMEEVKAQKTEAEKKAAAASEQVTAVEKRMSELASEKESLLAKLTEHFKARKEMEETASSLAGEKMDLVHKLGEAEDSAAKASERVKELEAEVAKVKSEMGETRNLKFELEAKTGEFTNEKSNLERQLQVLEEQKRLQASRVQELELQLSAVTEEFQQAKAEGSGSSNQSTVLELELARAETKVATKRAQELEAQVRALKEQIESHSAAVKDEERTAEDLAGEREVLERRLEVAVDAKNKALARVEELEGQLATAAGQVAAAAAAKREAETRVLGLEGAAGKMELEVQEAQAGRRSALEKLVGLEGQLALVMGREARHVAVREELEQRLAGTKVEIARHIEKSHEMEDRITELEAVRREVEERLRFMVEQHGTMDFQRKALEAQLAEARVAEANRGQELKVQTDTLARDMERLVAEKDEMAARLSRAEEAARVAQADKLSATERLQAEVQRLTEQLSGADGEGTAGAQALVEASELRAQVGELADRVRRAETEASQVRTERDRLAQEVEEMSKILLEDRYVAKQREAAMVAELDELNRETTALPEMRKEVERLRTEREGLARSLEEAKASASSLLSAVAALEAERQKWQLQVDVSQQLEQVKAEVVQVRSEKKSLEEQKITMAARLSQAEEALAAIEDVKLRNAVLEGEREKLAARAAEGERLREDNAVLTQQFVQLQSKLDGLLQTSANKRSAEAEQLASKAAAVMAEEAAQLRLQNTELKRKVAEQKMDIDSLKSEMGAAMNKGGSLGSAAGSASSGIGRVGSKLGGIMSPKDRDSSKQLEDLRRKVVALEGELQRKAEALAQAERRLGEKEGDGAETNPSSANGGPGAIQRVPSGKSSRVGPLSPGFQRDLEAVKLQDRIKGMEAEMKAMASALEGSQRDSQEKEKRLQERMERLQLANEQLKRGDVGTDQLHAELLRLQSQVAALTRKEHELTSQLSTHAVQQAEVQRLQEANEKLQRKLGRYRSMGPGNLAERMAVLETELAEALENNNMYKEQLKNAFANKSNVHAAAISNLGDADSVINEMVQYKKQAKDSEEELNTMRQKYSAMSLKFAEVEAQRQELVLMLRSSRHGRKL